MDTVIGQIYSQPFWENLKKFPLPHSHFVARGTNKVTNKLMRLVVERTFFFYLHAQIAGK